MRDIRTNSPARVGVTDRPAQEPAHHAGNALPIACLRGQLLPAGAGDGVVLRFPVVVGGAPAGGDPAALLEAEERCVDRPLVELEDVLADLLDPPRDPVAVQRAHRIEGLQHHEVEGALEDVGLALALAFSHSCSCWTATRV